MPVALDRVRVRLLLTACAAVLEASKVQAEVQPATLTVAVPPVALPSRVPAVRVRVRLLLTACAEVLDRSRVQPVLLPAKLMVSVPAVSVMVSLPSLVLVLKL